MGTRIDLVGKVFGCLTVVSKAETVMYKNSYKGMWNVRCECGEKHVITSQSLRKSSKKSCSNKCPLSYNIMGSRLIDVCCSSCGDKYQVRQGSIWKGNRVGSSRLCQKCLSKKGSDATKGAIAHNRLPDGQAAFNSLFMSYKRNAEKHRGINFSLSKDEFKELTSLECVYCGAAPSTYRAPESLRWKGKNSGFYIYNGIDRIDSSKGYETNNVVPCCPTCNYMKSDMSVDNFYSHIKKVLSYVPPKSGKRWYMP